MLIHKWRMRIFVFDPPDGGWHSFIKYDHLTKIEGGPAVILQKWCYCFHPINTIYDLMFHFFTWKESGLRRF